MGSPSATSTGHIPNFDDEICALALQLQEIEVQRDSQPGKYREDKPPDFALALLNYEAELKEKILFWEDLRIAHGVAKAVDTDAKALQDSRAEERQAYRDRNFALRLREGGPKIEDAAANIGDDRDREEEPDVTRAIQSTGHSGIDDEVENIAGFSLSYALRQREAYEQLSLRKLKCVICTDAFHHHEMVRLDCPHIYCKECLKSFFVRASTDESLFPPKCCGNQLPISLIEAELSTEELCAFHSAAIEFSTANRIYCAVSSCGKFIPPEKSRFDNAKCAACNSETCVHCKNLAHGGECPEDQALRAVIILAQGEGWRRCFGCSAMVELDTGCNHMTCNCSTEFCYVCGVKWKRCGCDIWEEGNLLRRAEQVVDREANYPIPAAERQQLVRDMQQDLQGNHECNHRGRWERMEGYRRKGHVCDVCGDRHWEYILACRQCRLTACEDCRRHRV